MVGLRKEGARQGLSERNAGAQERKQTKIRGTVKGGRSICTFAEGRTQPAQDPGAVMATTAARLDTRRVTAPAISLSDSRRGRKTPSCEPLLPPPAQMPETHKPPLLPPWDSRSGLELPPCPPCALGVPPLPPETPGAGQPLHLYTPIKGT